jgi:hypothetical protein
MRKYFILIALLLAFIPSPVMADDGCIAPDGAACTRPPGHENELIAPPVAPPENSPRPAGHENETIALPVQPPSVENSPRPPFEINYLKLERFDDETFTEKRFTRHRN